MKRATGSSASCCLSDLKNFHQVKAPPVAAARTIRTRTIAVQRFQCRRERIAASESLEVFDDRILLLRRKLGAVIRSLMTAIAVAGPLARHADIAVMTIFCVRLAGAGRIDALCLVAEELDPVFLGHVGDEAELPLIDHVIAAVKRFGPLVGALQEVANARDRAVVQIRAAQPDAVERLIGIAVGFAEMREPLTRIGGVKVALFGGERVGVVVEPAGIGANPANRVDLSDMPVWLAAEIVAARAVARGAVSGIERLAGFCSSRIDRERIFRRLVCILDQPVGDEFQRLAVERRRHRATAERGAAVALFD